MAEQSNTLSITPGNAKYDWSYYSFDPNVMRQGFRFTYNDTPVVYVPAEFVSKGLYTAGQDQYYSTAYLNRDIYNYLKPASIDSSLFSGTKGGEFLSSNFQNPYDGYIIDEATWKRFGGDKSVTKISPYTTSVSGDEKFNAPIQGISEVNGQLVYAGMRGGERAGEYTTYNAEGQSSLNAWKQSSGWLKRGASGIAEFFNNIPAIGKIAIALTVPGAAQAMAGFNVGQAIGKGDWGSAVLSALPLVVPGADGKPPVITVPGMDKAVGFISDSLNVSQSVAGALLQDGIKFAATGGDLSAWLKSQAAQFIGDKAGGFVAGLTKQIDLPGLQQMSRAMTTESTKALLLNQDVGKAAAGAFATYAVPMAFKSVPGYSEWAAKNPTTANGLQTAAIAAAKGGDPVLAVQDYTKRVFIESALPLAEKSLADAGIKITDNQRALMRQSLTAAVQDKPLDSALQNYAMAELKNTVRNDVAQREGWESDEQKQKAHNQYGPAIKPEDYAARQQGWEDLSSKKAAIAEYGESITPADAVAKEAGWSNADERVLAIAKFGSGITPEQGRKSLALSQASETASAKIQETRNALELYKQQLSTLPKNTPEYEKARQQIPLLTAELTEQQSKANLIYQQLNAASAGTTVGGITIGSVAPVMPQQPKEVPEQVGIRKPETEKTTTESIRDLASKAAESALGALIPSAEAAGPDRVEIPEPKAADGAQPSDYKYFFDVAQSADREAAYAALSPEKKLAVDRALQEYVASSQERQIELAKQYTAGTLTPTETPTEAAIDSGALGGKPGEPTVPTTSEVTPIEEFTDRGGLGGVTPTDQELRDIFKPPVSEEKKPEAPMGEVEPEGVDQQSIMDALARQQADTDAAIAALERATGQRITEGDTGILSQLAQQSASQRQMEEALRGQIGGISGTLEQQIAAAAAKQQAEQDAMAAALRGEIGGLGTKFQQDLLDAMAKQGASQSEMEAALRGEISGVGSTFQRSLQEAMAQQEAAQAGMETALRGEIGGLGGALQEQIAAAAAQQQAEQQAMEASLRGEIGGLGTTFDKRLADILAQQEEEQAAMQTALTGYDKRILDLMAQGESEQEAMQQALAEVQASQAEQQAATQQQIAGVQTGLGQQISGLGKTLGEALSGVQQQFGTTTQGLQQQIQQTQQQAGMGNLLAMLGMMQQKKQEAPPIPLVGEIKPFEFSTDLLEGIYQPSRTGLLGANDQLLKMTRG